MAVKTLCKLMGFLLVLGALGCGAEDPNKNLKPVDPKGSLPKLNSDKSGGSVDKDSLPTK